MKLLTLYMSNYLVGIDFSKFSVLLKTIELFPILSVVNPTLGKTDLKKKTPNLTLFLVFTKSSNRLKTIRPGNTESEYKVELLQTRNIHINAITSLLLTKQQRCT